VEDEVWRMRCGGCGVEEDEMWLPHALLIQLVVGLTQSEQLHVLHIELASFDLVHDSLQKSQPRFTHIIYYSLGGFYRSYQRGLHSKTPKIYRAGSRTGARAKL
jgi:hypothetical protein